MTKKQQYPEAQSKSGVLPRMTAKPPFTVPYPDGPEPEGETLPRRRPDAVPELYTKPGGDVTTVYELLRKSAAKFPDLKCVGTRKLVNTHVETKKVKKMVNGEEQEVEKKWTYFELSPYEYITYAQYETRALQVGSGFRKLGMVAGDRVHIFAATSANWLAVGHAASTQSMPIVTAYDTLGEEGLRYSMVATGAKAIFLDPHLLPTLVNVLHDAKEIQVVIWNDQHQINEEHVAMLKEAHPHVNILSFEELRKLGEENMVDPVPPTTEDLCCIMYTSGSTGTPKGVPIKHKAVCAAGECSFAFSFLIGLFFFLPSSLSND